MLVITSAVLPSTTLIHLEHLDSFCHQNHWQVPAFKLSAGDLVMVDNEPTSLTHVGFDPATFHVSWLFEEFPKMEWLVPLL